MVYNNRKEIKPHRMLGADLMERLVRIIAAVLLSVLILYGFAGYSSMQRQIAEAEEDLSALLRQCNVLSAQNTILRERISSAEAYP